MKTDFTEAYLVHEEQRQHTKPVSFAMAKMQSPIAPIDSASGSAKLCCPLCPGGAFTMTLLSVPVWRARRRKQRRLGAIVMSLGGAGIGGFALLVMHVTGLAMVLFIVGVLLATVGFLILVIKVPRYTLTRSPEVTVRTTPDHDTSHRVVLLP